MHKRKLIAGLVVPLALALGVVTPVLADTTGGRGSADLGLEGIAISSTAVNKTGTATVNGTITCSQDVQGAFVVVEIDQVVGRFHTLRGWGGTAVDCSASTGSAPWTLTVQPDAGKFAGGRATLGAFAEVDLCTDEDCLSDGVAIGPLSIKLGR